MTGKFRIDTVKVEAAAELINTTNKEMLAKLESTRKTMADLKQDWISDAADETMRTFNAFADKYFEDYSDRIDSYVQFLHRNVAEGYSETENQNKDLGSRFL